MNRRTLLQRLLAVAAAIVGAGMVAPSVAKAEWGENVTMTTGSLAVTGNSVPTVSDFNGISVGHNTTLGGTGRVINLGPGTYYGPADLRGMSNVTIRGAGPDQTIFTHPSTFEAMQADFGPSYGGVVLTRRGQQVVCKTGDEVIAALQDAAVVYREDVTVLPPHKGA